MDNLSNFFPRRNMVAVIAVGFLAISVALGVFLVQRQTQLRSKAASSVVVSSSKQGPYAPGETITLNFQAPTGKVLYVVVAPNLSNQQEVDAFKNSGNWGVAGGPAPLQTFTSGSASLNLTVPSYIEYSAQGETSGAKFFETSPPITTIRSNPSSGFTTGQQVTVTFDATDTGSGVSTIHTSVWPGISSANQKGSVQPQYQGFSASTGTRTATVPFYVEAVAVDANGNLETAKSFSTSNTDTTAPTVTITPNPSSGFVTGQQVTLTFNATDNSGGSGVAVIHTSIWPGISNASQKSSVQPQYQGFSASTGARTATVPFYVEAVVTDRAGNNNDGNPVTFSAGNTDTTAPVATITANPPGGFVTGQQVTLTFNATDNSGGSGLRVIHTAIWPGVSSKQEAIDRFGSNLESSAQYQGITAPSGTRIATVPFYVEARGEDHAQNVQDPPAAFGGVPGSVVITKVRIAENSADLEDTGDASKRIERNWTSPMRVNYEFKNKTPGPKTLHVKFYNAEGGTVTRSATINYQPNASPSPGTCVPGDSTASEDADSCVGLRDYTIWKDEFKGIKSSISTDWSYTCHPEGKTENQGVDIYDYAIWLDQYRDEGKRCADF